MSFIALATHDIIQVAYESWDLLLKPTFTLKLERLNKKDTYIMIFNFIQEDFYNCLMSTLDIKVLYQSVPAVNTSHPQQPRNFVVVFEVV